VIVINTSLDTKNMRGSVFEYQVKYDILYLAFIDHNHAVRITW